MKDEGCGLRVAKRQQRSSHKGRRQKMGNCGSSSRWRAIRGNSTISKPTGRRCTTSRVRSRRLSRKWESCVTGGQRRSGRRHRKMRTFRRWSFPKGWLPTDTTSDMMALEAVARSAAAGRKVLRPRYTRLRMTEERVAITAGTWGRDPTARGRWRQGNVKRWRPYRDSNPVLFCCGGGTCTQVSILPNSFPTTVQAWCPVVLCLLSSGWRVVAFHITSL